MGVESVEKKIGEKKKLNKKIYIPVKVRHGTTVCIDPESLSIVQVIFCRAQILGPPAQIPHLNLTLLHTFLFLTTLSID